MRLQPQPADIQGMELLLAGAGTIGGFGAGWLAGTRQHLLYRQPEYRGAAATGRRALVIRSGLGLACALVAAVALRPGHYAIGPGLLTAAFGAILCVLASTDFERRIIPNRLSYPAMAAALAFCWAWPDRDVAAILLGGGIAVIGAGAVFALGVVLGNALGLGDVKLAVLIGLLTGWPAFLPAIVFGALLAAVPSAFLMLTGRRKTYFSYGPYLAAGALAVLLFPGPFV